MADPTIALMDYLRNMGLEPDEGFLQEALQQLTQTVVEMVPLVVVVVHEARDHLLQGPRERVVLQQHITAVERIRTELLGLCPRVAHRSLNGDTRPILPTPIMIGTLHSPQHVP